MFKGKSRKSKDLGYRLKKKRPIRTYVLVIIISIGTIFLILFGISYAHSKTHNLIRVRFSDDYTVDYENSTISILFVGQEVNILESEGGVLYGGGFNPEATEETDSTFVQTYNEKFYIPIKHEIVVIGLFYVNTTAPGSPKVALSEEITIQKSMTIEIVRLNSLLNETGFETGKVQLNVIPTIFWLETWIP